MVILMWIQRRMEKRSAGWIKLPTNEEFLGRVKRQANNELYSTKENVNRLVTF